MLKLNVWKNQKEIKKTYECESYKVMFGTVEDMVKLTEKENMSHFEQIKALKPIMKDIFVGLTDAELRMVDTKEMWQVMESIVGDTKEDVAEISVIAGE